MLMRRRESLGTVLRRHFLAAFTQPWVNGRSVIKYNQGTVRNGKPDTETSASQALYSKLRLETVVLIFATQYRLVSLSSPISHPKERPSRPSTFLEVISFQSLHKT